MGKGRLRERTVQKIATSWIADRYQQASPEARVAWELEAVVRRDANHGSGRADGLVAVRRPDDTVYTIAIEAKSSRTLDQLKEYSNDDPWIVHGLIAGIAGMVGGGILGANGGMWFLAVIGAVVGFIVAGLGYLKLTETHQWYRLIDAVAQVQRYPANERWVAISADAYNQLSIDIQQQLQNKCHQQGVGLLIISTAKVVTQIEPRVFKASGKPVDYLGCYTRAGHIRNRLLNPVSQQVGVDRIAGHAADHVPS